MKRRTVWVAAVVAGAMAGLVQAQDAFPSRPLTIINPWAAGSATDVMARTIAEEMRKDLGQNVVVMTRDGASGIIE